MAKKTKQPQPKRRDCVGCGNIEGERFPFEISSSSGDERFYIDTEHCGGGLPDDGMMEIFFCPVCGKELAKKKSKSTFKEEISWLAEPLADGYVSGSYRSDCAGDYERAEKEAKETIKKIANLAYEKAIEAVGEDTPPGDVGIYCISNKARTYNQTKKEIRKNLKQSFLGEEGGE